MTHDLMINDDAFRFSATNFLGPSNIDGWKIEKASLLCSQKMHLNADILLVIWRGICNHTSRPKKIREPP